jgi:hypothetical protein
MEGMDAETSAQAAARASTEDVAGEWIGEVLAWVAFDLPGGKWSEPQAYVRWYTRDPDGEEESLLLGMSRIKVEKTERMNAGGQEVPVDFTDLVRTKRILRPVCVLPHPNLAQVKYYNPYGR